MSDSYQPIYDAVRSRIHGCDISEIVRSAVGEAFSRADFHIQVCMQEIASEYTRPFVVFRPSIAQDGDAWICCLGANIQEGVVGIGDTPDKCARDFDLAWYRKAAALKGTP